ncbi:MAG: serine/threonine-protein kinase [Aquincola sp.]|nr:serine/threonine-protein kinase [Aquincola sp.]
MPGSHFDLPAEDWATLRSLLDEALTLPAHARSAWIDALDDTRLAALKPHLRSLLERADSPFVEGLLNTIPKIETGQFAGTPPGRPTDPAPGANIGPYRLLLPLGEGGMATVWLAERIDMLQGRKVALKLPHGAWRRAGLAERLAREREILATLEHPNIARLYDAGVAGDGQPYLALEFVEGVRIDWHCERNGLAVRQRLGLFLQVARAVAYAHAHLVVHRDLKPSNILVTPNGEIRLLDFGIAKLLDADLGAESELTQQVGRALTPGYASPEQLRGDPVGIASDVYSLGVVLYELLATVSPYRIESKALGVLAEAILNADPKRPSEAATDPRLRRRLRGDLDTIVLKALKKVPSERYSTVHALVDDIERHLDQRPVLARPDSPWYRARRFAARNRVGVGVGLMAVVMLVGGSAAIAWQGHIALEERRRAEDVKDFIAAILRDADPYEGTKGSVSVVDLLRRALERVQQTTAQRDDTRVELLEVIAVSLKNLQDMASAVAAFDQAVDLARRSLGAEHSLTLRVRVQRLAAYRFQGRSDELRRELQDLLPLLRQRGADPADLVVALQMQAHDAIDMAHYDEAVKAASESLELAQRHLGPVNTETANAATLVALGHEYAGRPAQALKAAEYALELQFKAHGREPGHADVISARQALVRALGETGDLRRCIAEFDALLPDAVARFGAESVEVGFFKQNVVKFLIDAGELGRAEQMATDAEHIFAAHADLSPQFHPVARLTLADAWLASRRADLVVPVLQALSPQLLELLGPAHPASVRAEQALALAEAHLGRAEQATTRLQRLIDRLPPKKVTWPLWWAQSVVQRQGGHGAEAVRLARQALAGIAGARADIGRMRVLPDLGHALLVQGDYVAAAAAFKEAIELLDRLQTTPSAERADVVRGLALALKASSRPPLQPTSGASPGTTRS